MGDGSLRGRLAKLAAAFLRNESGGATIWNLIWITGFGVMAGLSIDSTNAWRHKTMMAATADAASTAGAWSLPPAYLGIEYGEGDYSTVKEKAFAFATVNMSRDQHGYYILRDAETLGEGPGDIHVGHWDFRNRAFTPGDQITDAETQPVNAIQVRLRRNDDRLNNVQTSLLQLAGFRSWEIETASTAAMGEDACLATGIIARGSLEVLADGAAFGNGCLHGQMKISIRAGTRWIGGDVASASTGPNRPMQLASTSGSEYLGQWNVSEPQYDGEGNPIPVPQGPSRHKSGIYPLHVDSIPTIGKHVLTGAPGFHGWAYPARPAAEVPSPPTVIVLPDGFAEVQGTIAFDHEPADVDLVHGNYQPASTQTTTRYEDLASLRIDGSDDDWPRDETRLIFDPATVDFQDLSMLEGRRDRNGEAFAIASATASPLPDHRIYFAPECGPGRTLTLSGIVRNATFITNCRIDFGEDSVVQNVVALTTADGEGRNENAAVQVRAGAVIGTPECRTGDVRLFSNGDIHAVAHAEFHGSAMFARSDIHFAADSTSDGTVMHAGDDITIEPEARIGALDGIGMAASLFADCPEDGVAGVPKSRQLYAVAIVD